MGLNAEQMRYKHAMGAWRERQRESLDLVACPKCGVCYPQGTPHACPEPIVNIDDHTSITKDKSAD